jgi:lipoprotein-anchoring transpeptidase ErfK/SrfK
VPARAGTAAVVKPTQELAVLLRDQEALAKPDGRAVRVGLLRARRPITSAPTVLPVLGHAQGPAGVAWLRVRLAQRPNGRTGWIRRSATAAAATAWHLVVSRASRRVTVYRAGRVVRAFPAIVGKASTPTPRGEFFVEESVQLGAGEVGAPFALALSARSYVLQEFAGGPGQIALHGLANVGGRLGTAVSHGCVRLDDGAMRWLVVRVGPGTPVTIAG